MKLKWLTATALVSMLALSPALAQQGQQQSDQQQPGLQQQQQPGQQKEGQPRQERQDQPEQQEPKQEQPELQQERQELQQERRRQLEQQQQQEAAADISALGKEKIVGMDLYGAQNERIGEVQDVVEGEGGDIEAVVLDIGGFLGIGGKQVAVPSYELQAEGDRIVARNLTGKEIEKLPEYQQAEGQKKQQEQ